MSGLLRRIKRSRPADAGEPHPEGRAAEAEGAATTAETPPAAAGPGETRADSSEAPTRIIGPGSESRGSASATEGGASDPAAASGATRPGTDTSDPAVGGARRSGTEGGTSDAPAEREATPTGQEAAAAGAPVPKRRRWPFRRRAREIPPATLAPTPVLKADPNVPAGIDPAAAPLRPPAGRRGRLRRRLRYLRRARELMLRDLGGLLYEIHRTGGGNVEAHRNVVGAKVQRIARVDAEAHALETALAAPRAEAVVFEPGVGGTCATCGELYGSDARFCANCGTPIGAVGETRAPETHEVVAEPTRRAFWRRAARPGAADEAATGDKPAGDDASDAPAGDVSGELSAEKASDEAATPRHEAGGEDAASEQTAAMPREEATRDDRTAAAPRDEGAANEPPRESGGDEPPAPSPRDEGSASEPPGEPGSDEPPREPGGDEPPREAGGDDPPPHNPRASGRNGRPEDRKAPGVAPSDPLVSRERP